MQFQVLVDDHPSPVDLKFGSEKDVTIRCQGRVVRTERSKNNKKKPGSEGEDWGGVACVIDHYKFIRKS